MIVDDHAAFRRTVRASLPATEVEFVECEDGQDAVTQYPRVSPDLVLMDVAMKNLDGLSATARIVAQSPTARIVIVSQYDDADLRAAALRSGACGFVPKDNLAQLRDFLRPQPAPAPARQH